MICLERSVRIETPKSAPQYELRVRHHGATNTEYEIWQVPAEAISQVKSAVRVAGLRKRNPEFVEHRVLCRLGRAGIRLSRMVDDRMRGHTVTDDLALTLGLTFRMLAPLRSRDNMRAVAKGIEAIEHEEITYWLGIAMCRPKPATGSRGDTDAAYRAESKTKQPTGIGQ